MSDPARPTWRNAAGIVALAVIFCIAAAAWQLLPVLRSHGRRAVGDLRHVASYGFDLSTCLIPCAEIVPAGMPKDGMPALRLPRLLTAAGCDSLDHATHARYLVPSDRVIGIVLGGVARAYPVRVLCWHEVADDTLGGVPIAVAYNPLCDNAAAFERASGGEGAGAAGTTGAASAASAAGAAGAAGRDTLDFGVSGLVWNSSQLLYDRRAGARGESLWSTLQGRAVAGPAAAEGRHLTGLPLAVVRWDQWRARHPETTVPLPEPLFRERYRRDPYGPYWNNNSLRFPVQPMPPRTGTDADLALKDPVVAVTAGGLTVAYPLRAIAARVAAGEKPGAAGGAVVSEGAWTTTQGAVALRFDFRADPPTVAVSALDPAARIAVAQAFWFAWYAQHPGGEVRWP